jgi:hypothetical protein
VCVCVCVYVPQVCVRVYVYIINMRRWHIIHVQSMGWLRGSSVNSPPQVVRVRSTPCARSNGSGNVPLCGRLEARRRLRVLRANQGGWLHRSAVT